MAASLRRPSPKLLPQAAASASRPSAFVRRHLLDLLSSCAVYLARPCPTGPSISVASASICARLFGTPPNPTLPRPMRASTCPPCLGSPPGMGPAAMAGRCVRRRTLSFSWCKAESWQNGGRTVAEWRQNCRVPDRLSLTRPIGAHPILPRRHTIAIHGFCRWRPTSTPTRRGLGATGRSPNSAALPYHRRRPILPPATPFHPGLTPEGLTRFCSFPAGAP